MQSSPARPTLKADIAVDPPKRGGSYLNHHILALARLEGNRTIHLPEAVVVIVEVPGSNGTTEAPPVPLVSDSKGGGGRGRLADAVGNVACSQETCSGVNGGGDELMMTTATDTH